MQSRKDAHGHGTVNALIDKAKDLAHFKGAESVCPATDRQVLPGWRFVGYPECICRVREQVSDGCRNQRGAHDQYRADPYEALSGTLDEAGARGRNQSFADDHAPPGARRYELFQNHDDGCIKAVLTH